jgi:hypothetical protein
VQAEVEAYETTVAAAQRFFTSICPAHSVAGTAEVSCTLTLDKAAAGMCHVAYTPLTACRHELDVLVQGERIPGAAFTIDVLEAPPSAEHTKFSGRGLDRAVVHQETEFHVQLLDRLGRPVACKDGNLRISIKCGAKRTRGKARALGAGRFEVTYTSEDSGELEITARLSKDGRVDRGCCWLRRRVRG